ncbi:MAG: hypothetical protein COB12_04775 [Flavobacterium sp.]|nr:MAG: hypothetical protein COB12_04775 [Flavobacterium sp.]
MKTLTREQYLAEFKKRAGEINISRESAISFYHGIGVLTPTGRISKNYHVVPGKDMPKPVRGK